MTTITRYYLGIRDKKVWDKWYFSPEFATFDECYAAYKDWIAANPGRVISLMQRRVIIADPVKP